MTALATNNPKHVDRTRLYLLGRGISHSLSPAMWNGVFAGLGMDARYGLLDVDDSGLEGAFARLHEPDVIGYNVTMPYKGWAYSRATVRSVDSARARGCNFIRARDGEVLAENTDVAGARALLDAIPHSERVLLLGAGGTAAAMLTALAGRADRVVLANRTAERAADLARRVSSWLNVEPVDWGRRAWEANRATLVINTTSVGMRDENSPLEGVRLPEGSRVYDVVYRSDPTPLQRQAARWGLPLADGLAHLEAQAVALLPHFGLDPAQAPRVRASLAAAVGREPCRWQVAVNRR
jgi:shikimate dehydrogenase